MCCKGRDGSPPPSSRLASPDPPQDSTRSTDTAAVFRSAFSSKLPPPHFDSDGERPFFRVIKIDVFLSGGRDDILNSARTTLSSTRFDSSDLSKLMTVLVEHEILTLKQERELYERLGRGDPVVVSAFVKFAEKDFNEKVKSCFRCFCGSVVCFAFHQDIDILSQELIAALDSSRGEFLIAAPRTDRGGASSQRLSAKGQPPAGSDSVIRFCLSTFFFLVFFPPESYAAYLVRCSGTGHNTSSFLSDEESSVSFLNHSALPQHSVPPRNRPLERNHISLVRHLAFFLHGFILKSAKIHLF